MERIYMFVCVCVCVCVRVLRDWIIRKQFIWNTVLRNKAQNSEVNQEYDLKFIEELENIKEREKEIRFF